MNRKPVKNRKICWEMQSIMIECFHEEIRSSNKNWDRIKKLAYMIDNFAK